jgi:serine/threonine protein phosphatase PrpC
MDALEQRGGATAGLDLELGQASDAGHIRSLNQDYVSCFVPGDEVQCRAKGVLVLVADGMGGHNAGEVASREAVERVTAEYYAHPGDDVGESLKHAFGAANQALSEMAEADPAMAGMGTTLVAAAIREGKATVANVGDSRAYLLRGNRLAQITVDHSWVEEQIQAGALTRQQAKRHPQRNLITRALGTRPRVDVDLFEVKLRNGDLLLLCTDGLSGQVSDQRIAQIAHGAPPAEAAAGLVGQANAEGGVDNVSVVLVQVGPRSRTTHLPQPVADLWALPYRQRIAIALAALIVLCIGAMILSLPVTNQRFVSGPAAAPYPAPVHFETVSRATLPGLAAELGYSGPEELQDAYPDHSISEAISEAVTEADLMPARPGIFVVGLARDWNCTGSTCQFRVEMTGQVYRFRLDRSRVGDSQLVLGGRRVRVFGQMVAQGDRWEARLIDVGASWWAWWQPAWIMVYADHDWSDPVWVYTTGDRNPYSVVPMDEYPALSRDARILVRGRWQEGRDGGNMAFAVERLYYLSGEAYVPLPGGPAWSPAPTVTLRPTPAAPGP